MTVEFVPKSDSHSSFNFSVANNTWFVLLRYTDIGLLLGDRCTNDPIDASQQAAMKCADIIAHAELPDGWGGSMGNEHMRQMFYDFFISCDGFTTH